MRHFVLIFRKESYLRVREKINEVLKINDKSNLYNIPEVIGMIYVIYKDIEKIKKHLGIEDKNKKEE